MLAWTVVALLVPGWAGVTDAQAMAAPAGSSSPATAGAEALIDRGLTARRQGRDEEALQLFRSAYALAPSPRGLAQIALAEQALGQWLGAEGDLSAALTVTGDVWVARNGTVLEKALGTVREHIGQLTVLGSPAGATVKINGKVVGKLPMTEPVHVASGEIVLAVESPGYDGISRKVTVAAKSLARETIELPSAAVPARGASAVSVGAATAKSAPAASQLKATAAPVPSPAVASAEACRAHAPAVFRFETSAEGFTIKSDEFAGFKTLALAGDRSWCSPGALVVGASYDLKGARNKHGRLPNQVGQLMVPLAKHLDLAGKTLTAHIYVDAPPTASFGAVVFAINKGAWVGGKFTYPLTPGKWWSITATFADENPLYDGGTSRVDDVEALAIQVDALGASSIRTWSGKIYVDDVEWR